METDIDIFPVAWCDDAAMQGLVGNVASDAAKHYWERSNWSDREMAERLNNPLYGGAYVEMIIKQKEIEMHKYMTVTMPDGSIYGVPVDIIARNRAANYAQEFDGDIRASLEEDTLPLFEFDDYEIQDWAVNNMNWSDFDGHQIKIKEAPPPDFQDAWMCGEKGFCEL